ncbi:MAG TPA: ion channel [Thermodesulfobacteriota bacterium]|nr:ion channel [Thermodesulfobacteriota bacterium]
MPNPEQEKANLFARIIARVRVRRFSYLAKSLVLLIIAYPYLEANTLDQIILTLLTIMVMIAAIIAVSKRRRDYIIMAVLSLPWFVSLIVNLPLFELDGGVIIRKEIVFAVLLFFYTTISIFIHLIRSREVTTEILFAAVCVYLLIGLSWAALYVLIELVTPGSFVDTSGHLAMTPPRYLFFSFVTLTTVGYGNIIPATDQARSIAVIEAIVGQLYITIMVARLVGLHISKPRAPEA